MDATYSRGFSIILDLHGQIATLYRESGLPQLLLIHWLSLSQSRTTKKENCERQYP